MPPTFLSCARGGTALLSLPPALAQVPTPSRCPSPSAYTLGPIVNVDRLKPFVTRAGTSQTPLPVSDTGQEGEHEPEVELRLRSTANWCVACSVRYLVRRRNYTSADDTWMRGG